MTVPQKGAYRAFYQSESARYDRTRYRTRYGRLFETLHHGILKHCLADVPVGSAVLEVACGTGHVTPLLSEQGLEVFACDLTPEMMQHAVAATAERTPAPRFVNADARRLPFASDSFDVIVSTRFLHLFPKKQQRDLIIEMSRVLRPGGLLLVDFDNWYSRWLLAIPYAIYNLLRYRRLAPLAFYNRPSDVVSMLEESGLRSGEILGIGGTHLVLADWASHAWALRLGALHERGILRLLAEQFMATARKA